LRLTEVARYVFVDSSDIRATPDERTDAAHEVVAVFLRPNELPPIFEADGWFLAEAYGWENEDGDINRHRVVMVNAEPMTLAGPNVAFRSADDIECPCRTAAGPSVATWST
jgi:hypothetical protein